MMKIVALFAGRNLGGAAHVTCFDLVWSEESIAV